MNSWRSGCISQYNWAANYQLSCLHLSGHLSTCIKLFFNPLRVKQGRWASHFVKESSFEKQHKEMCQKGQSTRSWETWSHDHQITLEGGNCCMSHSHLHGVRSESEFPWVCRWDKIQEQLTVICHMLMVQPWRHTDLERPRNGQAGLWFVMAHQLDLKFPSHLSFSAGVSLSQLLDLVESQFFHMQI